MEAYLDSDEPWDPEVWGPLYNRNRVAAFEQTLLMGRPREGKVRAAALWIIGTGDFLWEEFGIDEQLDRAAVESMGGVNTIPLRKWMGTEPIVAAARAGLWFSMQDLLEMYLAGARDRETFANLLYELHDVVVPAVFPEPPQR